MKNITINRGKLQMIKRLKNSRNGNPRFKLAIVDHNGNGFSFVTKPDSMIAYLIENYIGQQIEAVLGSYYNKTTLINFKPIK